MIDWRLAAQLAGFVATDPGHELRPTLPALVAESEALVGGYTGLVAHSALPAAELVGRPAWTEANLRSLRPVLEPLTERVGRSAGPLGPVLRGAAGVLLAAEVGVLMGYVSRRVLGQYELVLLDPQSPARLLFVGPNIDEAAQAMDADQDDLLRWVALHEVTHALQFGGVPWLRDHLGEQLSSLIATLEVSLDPARLLRLPGRADLRAFVDAVAAGELITLVAGAEQRVLIDRVQATMSVLEGHAEHVMDAVGAQAIPSLPRLREAMTRRRRTQSPGSRLLSRVLGLEMKMRQYELGKAFCDAVVARHGIETLNRVWESADLLPTVEELEIPDDWVRRIAAPAAAPTT